MINIIKRPDRELYSARVPNPLLGKDKYGRVAREVIYGKSKDEVRLKVAQLELDILGGSYIENVPEKTSEHLTAWINSHKQELKPNTYQGYKTNIVKHTIPYIGEIELQKLEPIHIKKLYKTLMEKDNLSYRSVSYIHRVLSHSFKDAISAKKIKSNPTGNCLMKRPREEAMEEAAAKNDFVAKYLNISGDGYRINRTLEIGEILQFLNWLKENNHRAFLPAILTVGLGGLRRGEMLAATWSQIFLEDKHFVVARSLSLTKEAGISIDCPKTAASIRVVPMPDTLIPILNEARIRQLENKLKCGAEYKSNDLIICLDNGDFITPSSFTHIWRRATKAFSKETGIKEFTHHALRSSIASFYKASGFNDLVAAKFLGHSNPNVTREYYLRPVESELNKAAMLLDEQLCKLG